jgi:two-component system cell cycle sensor histidine kinase/response regulator CckA
MKKTSKIAQRRDVPKKKKTVSRAPRKPAEGAQTVLVVEDEERIGNMAQLFLELHGYRVLVANSGAAALAIWGEHAPEIALVITDMLMPSIDGATLTRALRKKRRDLPVILASGVDAGDFTEELKGIKFSAHLEKPYTRHQLLAAVEKALAGQTD